MKSNRNSGHTDLDYVFVIIVAIFVFFTVAIAINFHRNQSEQVHECKMEYMKTERPVEDILKICS